MTGVSALPRVLMKFGEEEPAHVLGRLIVVAGELGIGVALLVPLVRSYYRKRSDSARRDDSEEEGW